MHFLHSQFDNEHFVFSYWKFTSCIIKVKIHFLTFPIENARIIFSHWICLCNIFRLNMHIIYFHIKNAVHILSDWKGTSNILRLKRNLLYSHVKIYLCIPIFRIHFSYSPYWKFASDNIIVNIMQIWATLFTRIISVKNALLIYTNLSSILKAINFNDHLYIYNNGS